MPTTRLVNHLIPLLGLSVAVTMAASVDAQVAQPAEVVNPNVVLRYRELNNREPFAFTIGGKSYTRSVGDLTMEFPSGRIPIGGLDPVMQTFCVEPLVPMYAGDFYPFQVDPLGLPKAFGLPDSPEGVAAGEKRARFLRELYGRYYTDVAADPKVNAPAFQAALWELSQETEVPEGPMPFSLFTGAYRADYPGEADAPPFVRQAQKYVQSLSGDDTVFASNPALANYELSRLTALQPVGGLVAGQSQLALRATPTGAGTDAAGLGGPALGTLGGIPTGFGGAPLRGAGGPAVGGVGGYGGGGGIGGFGATPVTSTTTPGADSGPPRSGPAEGTPGVVIPTVPTIPTAPPPDTGTVTSPPGSGQVQTPPGTLIPTAPVPAPAGVVLAAVGLAVFGGRRLLVRPA